MKKNKKEILEKVFIASSSAAVGVGAGMLFAPKKGSEIRHSLKMKIKDLIANIKSINSKEIKEKFEKKIKSLEKEIKNLDKEKVLSLAKTKVELIKIKTDELVELAKKKGNAALEKSANEVREKAIIVTKSVLKKLEKNKK